MNYHRHWHDGIRWRTVGKLVAGQSQVQVYRKLVVMSNVVSNLEKQFQNTGSIMRKLGKGRPRATTAYQNEYLSITLRRNRHATASQLSSNLFAATESKIYCFQFWVSKVTVSKKLHEGGLFPRRSAVCVPLTLAKMRIHLS